MKIRAQISVSCAKSLNYVTTIIQFSRYLLGLKMWISTAAVLLNETWCWSVFMCFVCKAVECKRKCFMDQLTNRPIDFFFIPGATTLEENLRSCVSKKLFQSTVDLCGLVRARFKQRSTGDSKCSFHLCVSVPWPLPGSTPTSNPPYTSSKHFSNLLASCWLSAMYQPPKCESW